MNNLDFLKQILTQEDEYYIVAKKNEYNTHAHKGRYKDSIILTCIPYQFKRGVKPNEILLCEIENLRSAELMNIHINEPYAPFQSGMTFYNIYCGFPIKGNIKEFMIKALALNSDSIYDYQELAEQEKETKTTLTNG